MDDNNPLDKDFAAQPQTAPAAKDDWPALETAEADRQTASAWSPPQFGLSTILLWMILAGGFFTVIRYFGPDAIFPTIMVGALGWFALGCWRLFRLARRNGGHGDIGNDLADEEE